MPPESEDNDSMAEYGEGEAGKWCYTHFSTFRPVGFDCYFYGFIYTLVLPDYYSVFVSFYLFINRVEGMNEDGSFIGQYGKKRGDGSSAFATLV